MRAWYSCLAAWAALLGGGVAEAQVVQPTLFTNVRVFDGTGAALSAPTNVLVDGNPIVRIAPDAASPGARVIDGTGRTLMPGLIDVHVHLTFGSLSMAEMMNPEFTP